MTVDSDLNLIVSPNLTIKGEYVIDGAGFDAFSIGNDANIVFENLTFKNFYASTGVGGAIFNNGTIGKFVDVSFSNNFSFAETISQTNYAQAYGGAIFNQNIDKIGYLDNVTFENNFAKAISATNKAHAQGGAIFNASSNPLNILANNGDTIFTGNYVQTVKNYNSEQEQTEIQSNAIHNNGTINLNSNNHKIVINDGISGDSGVININKTYSFVNTFDYTTKTGVKIKSEPLHAVQVEPGLKFIANLENGWKPYAQVSMIWNFLDKTDVKANDVKLPEMSIKPYVRYGIGLQKSWKDEFSGFAQAFVTHGGRNGVGLQAGFSRYF